MFLLVFFYLLFFCRPTDVRRDDDRQRERQDFEVNIRDLIKQPRKNKVFDYKSLIYETELKVLIMFQRDKHLQPETE